VRRPPSRVLARRHATLPSAVSVSGTRLALPKKGFIMGRARAEVRVLPPVETAGLTLDDVGALRDRVREVIVRTRAELQQATGRRDGRIAVGG
jgi:hypothetical protein